MGKLNIAHHKSYHPYRRDNIERVRKDEEEARLKEAREEGRMMLADSEARIDQLRQRAGIAENNKKKRKEEEDIDKLILDGSSTRPATLPTTGGHINFFEDLEQNAITAAIKATKKPDPSETDKGVPLAPSAKDLKPWYSERKSEEDDNDNTTDERKLRDSLRKSAHDPLTSITQQLASRPSTTTPSSRRPPLPNKTMGPPELQARITRESTERERALALIKRKQRELAGSETPSTVYGGAGAGDEYGDMFNRKEVEEAHRWRERRGCREFRHRSWDEDHHRRR